mgnify:CR=1 FL=1
MKNFLPLLAAVATSATAFAQLPVSTTAENKNVVLEEFTGIYCGFCPDGHLKAKTIKDANPDDVFLLNIHTGSYATPQGADPDFRTSFGAAIAGQTGLTGYPSGTVNRHVFSPNTATALSRSVWQANANTILSESSYVNVALEGTIDFVTREMIVDVEMYFTADGPTSVNLNVALTQDHIEGPQSGASSYNPDQILSNGKYDHGHMLRHLLTGQWGEAITTTTSGTTVTRQFTYILPDDISDVDMELGNFEIIAFIAEGQQEIITGNDGTIEYTNLPSNNATLMSAVSLDAACGEAPISISIKNNGENEMTSATIQYGYEGLSPETYNWTGSLSTFEKQLDIELPAITSIPGAGTLNISISNVNSTSDDILTDNELSKVMDFHNFDGPSFELTIVQDRYGDEITWEVIDETNGQTIASGGPYAQLSATGTETHTHPLTLSNIGCHSLKVYDSYGDGFNSGYGEGSYSIKNSAGTEVFNSDAIFNDEALTPFYFNSVFLSLEEESANSFSVYPNPSSDVIFIDNQELIGNTVQIINTLGQVVKTNTIGDDLKIDVSDLSNGAYFMNVSTGKEVITKSFSVAK